MLTQEKIFNLAEISLKEENRRYSLENNQRYLMTSEINQIVEALHSCGFLTRSFAKFDSTNQWDNPTWEVEENGRKIGSVSVNLDYTIQINLTQMSLCEVAFASNWSNALEAAGSFAILDRIESKSGPPPDPLTLDYDFVERHYPGLASVKNLIRSVNELQSNRPGTCRLDNKAISLMAQSLFEQNLINVGLPTNGSDYYYRASAWDVNCKDDTDGRIELWGESIFLDSPDRTIKDGLHAIMIARAIMAAAKLKTSG